MSNKLALEQTMFYRWGIWVATHKKWVLLFWLLMIVFSAGMAP